MKRAALLTLLLAPLLPLNEAAAQPEALAAMEQTVAAVDGWVEQAQAVEGQLSALQERANDLEALQGDLHHAVAGGDAAKIRELVTRLDPTWGAYLEGPQKVRELLRKVRPGFDRRFQTMDEALLALGAQARTLNQRVLSAYQGTLAGQVDRALSRQGPLGKAIQHSRNVKAAWLKLKRRVAGSPAGKIIEAKAAYDDAVSQVEALFRPEARSAYAGLEAIQRILQKHKDSAPFPVNQILGAYADAVGAYVGALKRIEHTINSNARQMVVSRTIAAAEAIDLSGLGAKYPGYDLAVMEDRPIEIPLVPGQAYAFEGIFFLRAGGTWYRLSASASRVQRVARWLVQVGKDQGAANPALLEQTLDSFDRTIPDALRTFQELLLPFLPSIAVHRKYLELRHDDPAQVEEGVKFVQQVKRWTTDGESAFAHYLLDPAARQSYEHYVLLYKYKLLVRVRAHGRNVALEPGKLQLTARVLSGASSSSTSLPIRGDGVYAGLVDVTENATRVFAEGSYAGGTVDQDMATRPATPAVVELSVGVSLAPKPEPEPEPEPEVDTEPEPGMSEEDLSELEKDNEGKGEEDGEGEEEDDETEDEGLGDDLPAVGDEAADGDPDPDLVQKITDEIIDAILDGMDTHTGRGDSGNDTNAQFDPHRPGTDDPRFGALDDAIARGDAAAAAEVFTELTGAPPADPLVTDMVSDDRQADGYERAGAGLDDAYDGPRPKGDEDYVAGQGLDPAHAADPIPAVDVPGAATAQDVLPPNNDPDDPKGRAWNRSRARVGSQIQQEIERQGRIAQSERGRAQAAVNSHPIPTRGGMRPLSAGNARTVTLVMWDHGSEDGDRIQVWVGGRLVIENLYLTNAPQNLTVALTPPFTDVKVIALNEGSSSPNTATVQVRVGGRVLSGSDWNLKTFEMGSTAVRSQ